jgi:hypothetical protein
MTAPRLSILCITRAEPHAPYFLAALASLAHRLSAQLVLGTDGVEAYRVLHHSADVDDADLIRVESRGCLEDVHDQVLNACDGAYVLRLDDDEAATPAMQQWLERRDYEAHDHWKFARAHLWGGPDEFIVSNQLWPDHQTRLSVRAKAGGRTAIHCGSPFGGGELAPVVLAHHKFLVKSIAERRAVARRYDAIQPGAGTGGMLAFNVPEDAYDQVTLAPIGEGQLRPLSATRALSTEAGVR